MENFGIDIGDYKTVITGSSRNGRILKDNIGSRSISTQIQLSTPRAFGNNFSNFKKEDLLYRYRHFIGCTDKKCLRECQDLLTMYFCYMNRVIHSNIDRHPEIDRDTFKPMVTLTTKLTKFADIHRMLMSAEAANLNISTVFDDLTAAAVNLIFKVRKAENFAIIDFGHSQTAIGLFSFKNNHLQAIKIERINIGGGNFDEKIFYHVLTQCSLKQKNNNTTNTSLTKGITVQQTNFKPCEYEKDDMYHVLKETIIPRIKKYKMVLSNTDVFEDTLEFGEDTFKVQIHQNDYKAMIKDDIEKIKNFIIENIEKFKSISDSFETEILGGNSNNVFIKEMLAESNIKILQSADSHETVSFGAAIAGAVAFYTKSVTINDCLIGDIKLNDEIIFKDGDLLGKEISIVQENDELLIVLDSGKRQVKKEQKEDEKENHTIKIPFNKNITITHFEEVIFQQSPKLPCAIVLNRNKTVLIKGRPVIDEVSHLLEFERKYRKCELEIEQIGIINNDFQLFLEKLETLMSNPRYFALFSEDDISAVVDISLEYMYEEMTKNLKKEEEKIDLYKKQIDPFIAKMKELVEEKKKEIMELIGKSNEKLKNHKTFTPSIFKLQSRLNGVKLKLEKCTFDGDLSVLNVELLDEEIVKMEIDIEKEILQKKKEQKEREEKEKVAKEELEKQKKEKEQSTKENENNEENVDKKENQDKQEKENVDEKVPADDEMRQ